MSYTHTVTVQLAYGHTVQKTQDALTVQTAVQAVCPQTMVPGPEA